MKYKKIVHIYVHRKKLFKKKKRFGNIIAKEMLVFSLKTKYFKLRMDFLRK